MYLSFNLYMVTKPSHEYQDHLGNVRLTFTTRNEADTATATLETANVTAEQSEFLYYEEAVKINAQLFDHSNEGTTYYSTRLSGSVNEQTGLAKSISVMPGDTVRAEVYAKYLDTNSSNWTTALNNLITSIANGTAPAGTFVDGGAAGSTGGTTPSFIGLLNKGSESGTAPKAYLNYLIFDRNYVLLNGGFVRMSEAAREYGQDGAHEKLAAEIAITEPGYVYLYLSNDNVSLGGSQIEVYFDDFKVIHIKSPVIASDDYYPFGLTFNSYSRENSVENRYLYNQGTGEKTFKTERVYDLGLNVDQSKYRTYDYITGRWWHVDPLAELGRRWSPYNYAMDNPIRFIDPDGMFSLDPNDQDGEDPNSAKAALNAWRNKDKKKGEENNNQQNTKAAGTSQAKGNLSRDGALAGVQQPTDGEAQQQTNGGCPPGVDCDFVNRAANNGLSTADLYLSGIGTAGLVAESQSAIIKGSRSGFTSGKLSMSSPRIFSKATATNVYWTAKGIGFGLTAWSLYSNYNQFKTGEIGSSRFGYNNLNIGVGVFVPQFAIPMAAGDYLGQRYSNEIVNDVSQPGGFLFEGMKFTLEFLGLPTSPGGK